MTEELFPNTNRYRTIAAIDLDGETILLKEIESIKAEIASELEWNEENTIRIVCEYYYIVCKLNDGCEHFEKFITYEEAIKSYKELISIWKEYRVGIYGLC